MRCSGGVRARHRKQLVERRKGLWRVVGEDGSREETEDKRRQKTERDGEAVVGAGAAGKRRWWWSGARAWGAVGF
jgi:hypothetical protein